MSLLARLYARRIVNVNVNIIAAGLLALLPLTLTIHLATTRLGLSNKAGISALSFFADLVFDAAIYFSLHWLANQSKTFRRARPAGPPQRGFIRDASLIQFQRAILSPLLYILAIGLQQLLLYRGVNPAAATAAGFATGIAASRVLHTIWMLRQERAA